MFIITEGSDGSGKSTMSMVIYDHLVGIFGEDRVIHTRHPGATAVGRELRTLVKHSDFEIDMMTERMIMASDNCAFINQILIPSLKENKIVIADRNNFISDYPYGMSAGVSYGEIEKVHNALRGAPKADMTIIYKCPWEVLRNRMFGDIEDGKQLKCRIESRGDDYFKNVISKYDEICDDSPKKCAEKCACPNLRQTILRHTEKIESIDASQSINDVKEQTIRVVNDLLRSKYDLE